MFQIFLLLYNTNPLVTLPTAYLVILVALTSSRPKLYQVIKQNYVLRHRDKCLQYVVPISHSVDIWQLVGYICIFTYSFRRLFFVSVFFSVFVRQRANFPSSEGFVLHGVPHYFRSGWTPASGSCKNRLMLTKCTVYRFILCGVFYFLVAFRRLELKTVVKCNNTAL